MIMRTNTMSHTAALLLLLTLICISWNYSAASEGAVDCCLTTVPQQIPRRLVKSYYTQSVEMGCRLPATVFITKKGKRLCAPPADTNNWVQKLIKQLKVKPRRSQVKPSRKSKGKKQ